ncbi:Serine carboxypeptidase-like 45 [Linum perenne]
MRISTRSSLLQRGSRYYKAAKIAAAFERYIQYTSWSAQILEVSLEMAHSALLVKMSWQGTVMLSTKKASEGTDVCLREKMAKFLNREDVQEALRVRKTNWRICSRSRNFTDDKRNWENPTIELVGSLVMRGIRVLIYSVDEVTFVPFLGTRVLVNDLANKIGLNTTGAYQGWLVDGQKLMGKR